MALDRAGTNNTGYEVGGSASTATQPSTSTGGTEYWPLSRLKKTYLDYLGNKREEINEQQEARRYRHCAQWTREQIETFNRRKQPIVTYNRIGRKIDGIIGLVEKLRQDPKAFPRTPQHEQGAELSTAVLNYALDQQDWKAKSPAVAENGAVDGIGGIEIEITSSDGDPEVEFDVIDQENFFYDPRSFRLDFSDARFMGVGKWVDAELAKEMFPDKAAEIDASLESGSDLSTNSNREQRWFVSDGTTKRVRLIDQWYKHKGQWRYCIYTGSTKLMEGPSHLEDEKGRTECKFIMFSAAVDHDGDRYGFVRNMKSANDEINMRRSKGLHLINSRRMIAEAGAFDDVEQARNEAARADGIVIRNPGREATFDDSSRQIDVMNQLRMLEDAKNEIENFGPNPALIGQGIENKSGRAISLLQQAGIAELGPYILAYRGWKIRVYRALWNAIRTHWTSEKIIRVTDNEGAPQFLTINQVQVDPNTLQPTMVNSLGDLDVDIILDEGPDQVNMMADAYDTLSILAAKGTQIPPEVLIELSPLTSSVKRRVLGILEQSKQAGAQSAQGAQAGAEAEIRKINAEADYKEAQAIQTMQEVELAPAKLAQGAQAQQAKQQQAQQRQFV